MAKKEYIKLNELIKMLEERHKDKYRSLKNASYIEDINEIGSEINELEAVIDIIKEDFPAADVEPVKHGRWEWGDIYDDGDVCSVCNYDSYREPCKYKYCPNCGAKMDGSK